MHRRFMTMDAEKKGYITVQQFSLLPELCCNPLCELITASFDANKVALSRSALCSRVTCSLGQQDRLHGIPHLPRRLSPDDRRHQQAAGAPRFSAIPTLAHGKDRDALALALAIFGLMRVQFCFRMFDSQKNGSVSIEEARALFFSTATPPLPFCSDPSDSTVFRSGRLSARHFRARWHGRDPASYSAGAPCFAVMLCATCLLT